MANTLKSFVSEIGLSFTDQKLLERAFIHRSYLNEHPGTNLEHNERLEFLGDAVLELVVTEYLYLNYPNPEGELTNWRSAIVKGEMLGRISKELKMGDFLKLSRGEEKSGGKARNLLLANAFEALIGAIYLDQGYDKARDFIHHYLLRQLAKIIEEGSFIDSKSQLQEIIQDKKGVTPTYQVLEQSGPDHQKHFIVGVYDGHKLIGKGEGASKRKAEQEAAFDALKYYL